MPNQPVANQPSALVVVDADTTAQLVPEDLLPAGRGADAVDEALVDEAVHRLNNVAQIKGLETARAVAECVIDLFFDGRAEVFFARGKSHLSFLALKQRADLQISYNFMWNACAVYDQLRRLPQAIGEALPLAHHKLLLPLKDDDKKRELATQAVAQGLTKERFAQEVDKAKKELGMPVRLGRPPLPAFVKGFGKLAALVELVESEEVTAEAVAAFGEAETAALLAEVDGLLGRLGVVVERVRGVR